MELKNLAYITGKQVTEIAKKANVSREYVRLLLSGEREKKSVRARAILAAAKTLNTAIESGMKRADKKLMLIGEND